MASLRELVEEHGFGIVVASWGSYTQAFKILEEDEEFYKVEYINSGTFGLVLKEYYGCNDYEIIEKEQTDENP